MTETSSAADQVRQAAARLTWWTSRGDVRRRLLGSPGELSANDAWLLGTIAAAGTDPADGRVVLVTVTDEGRRWREQLDASGAAVFADAMRGWPPDDVATLATLLTRLADHLTIDGGPPDDGTDPRRTRAGRTRKA